MNLSVRSRGHWLCSDALVPRKCVPDPEIGTQQALALMCWEYDIYVCIYIYIYAWPHMYIYIYIYTQRLRPTDCCWEYDVGHSFKWLFLVASNHAVAATPNH